MSTLRDISLSVLRAILLLAFAWLILFWTSVLVYSVDNFIKGRVRGVEGRLFHIFR